MSPKTKQKSKQTTASTPAAVKQAIAAFDKVIEQALRQFRDPAALGEESPLAAPYFLGEHLSNLATADGVSVLVRGQAVQRLLLSAADALVGQHTRWGQLWRDLLQATYFR